MSLLKTKALYNSLRMNWLNNPTLAVEKWQVEDYRSLSLEELFERLTHFHIDLTRHSFIAFTDNVDTPEDLADALAQEEECDPVTQDKIYLLVFELWRRLVPQKPCLTVFCDELDHQIQLYDQDKLENPEDLQDAIANLQEILDDNVDAGVSAAKVFESVAENCANDLESFLYDFIADCIDEENYSYASDLVDGFYLYIPETKWFDLLKARLQNSSHDADATSQLKKIATKNLPKEDLPFNLELLSCLAKAGERDLFLSVVKRSLPLIEVEEDFQDMLELGSDFCHFIDAETCENEIQSILDQRQGIEADASFSSGNHDAVKFLQLIKQIP